MTTDAKPRPQTGEMEQRWRHVLWIAPVSVVLVLLLCCVGVLVDVDVCINTSQTRVRRLFLGIRVSEEIHHTDESQWLSKVLGIDGPIAYRDYLLLPPYVSADSPAPGNRLSLRSIHAIYDRHPEARSEIREYLQDLFASGDPQIDGSFVDQLCEKYPSPRK